MLISSQLIFGEFLDILEPEPTFLGHNILDNPTTPSDRLAVLQGACYGIAYWKAYGQVFLLQGFLRRSAVERVSLPLFALDARLISHTLQGKQHEREDLAYYTGGVKFLNACSPMDSSTIREKLKCLRKRDRDIERGSYVEVSEEEEEDDDDDE